MLFEQRDDGQNRQLNQRPHGALQEQALPEHSVLVLFQTQDGMFVNVKPSAASWELKFAADFGKPVAMHGMQFLG